MSAQGDTLTLAFGGDVLFDRGIRSVLPDWPEDICLRQKDEDALIVNLECPLTSRRSSVRKQIVFRADTTSADLMRRMGITHAALANNHSIDQGMRGLEETASQLRRVGITPIGCGRGAATRLSPAVLKKGEVEVAVFNDITFPIENWVGAQAEGSVGIANVQSDSLAAVVRRYHARHPRRHIIVFVHWGTEFQPEPNFRQQIDAAKLVAAGAEAVIGQHPHVVQPVRMVGSAPVFYSIGNFVFDQNSPECRQAVVARLQFTGSGLASYTSVPVAIERGLPARAVSFRPFSLLRY